MAKLFMGRAGERKAWLDLLEAKEKLAGDYTACMNYPDLFFPEPAGPDSIKNVQTAKDWCSQCPIRVQCLNFALEFNEDGIWGGLTVNERNMLKKKNKRSK